MFILDTVSFYKEDNVVSVWAFRWSDGSGGDGRTVGSRRLLLVFPLWCANGGLVFGGFIRVEGAYRGTTVAPDVHLLPS